MRVVTQKPDEERADYLIRVVIAMLESNSYQMENIVYDEAECDAFCLVEDLKIEFQLHSDNAE